MKCPNCDCNLPVDRYGNVDWREVLDRKERIVKRVRHLTIYRQWDHQSAFEQAKQEIYFGSPEAL
ncbi:MAG: hypothetical protein RBT11_19015 [Desulfobacterales bacterium]|jgi:hypothetical protein|nr:hypothetical protein [Desulfobacterales bacterium]